MSLALAAFVALAAGGCRGGGHETAFRPDSVLRADLGLTDADEVHRVRIAGGETELLDPPEVEVGPGAWVEFVSTDWRVHVVRFEPDSLKADARAFLDRTGQMSSPPMVERDARFVVSFAEAPPGRYPFVSEGNGGPARGVVVVGGSR